MSEKEPTPNEMREAEALARALEGDGSSPDVPEDALQTSALLRSHELDQVRSQAVFERVLAGTDHKKSARTSSRLRWLIPVGGLAAVLVAWVLFMVPGIVTLDEAAPASLPPPDAELLQAQGKAASQPDGLAGLHARMHRYRHDMYRTLSERYSE
jgi:hypothetical protein